MRLGRTTQRRCRDRAALFDRVSHAAFERGDHELADRAAYWAQLARMTAQMGQSLPLR
jgi:hypothetical protein